MNLQIKLLTLDAIVPVKAHSTDSGFDLFANEDVIIEPGQTVVIKTGVAIQLPPNHEAQIRPKSGVTSKTDLRVQLGTVDEGYTGEIGVIVDNISQREYRGVKTNLVKTLDGKFPSFGDCVTLEGTYKIYKGDKIAQMVIAPVAHPTITVVDDLNSGERGSNGFGSTGVRQMEGY